jgi:hypothetical protein
LPADHLGEQERGEWSQDRNQIPEQRVIQSMAYLHDQPTGGQAGRGPAGTAMRGASRRGVLAERKRVGFSAGVEEGDLEGVLGDRTLLADELVQPRFDASALALAVNVDAIGLVQRLPVQTYLEPYGGCCGCAAQDEVEATGVKAVGDLPVGCTRTTFPPRSRSVSGAN